MHTAKRKKRSYTRLILWLSALTIVSGLGGGWYVWRSYFEQGPIFQALLINVNQEPRRVPAGGTLSAHPNDRLKIVALKTNIPLNFDTRLTSTGLDIEALMFEELPISALLPGNQIYDHYHFKIVVKHRNSEIGFVDLDIQPFVEDWLDKIARIIDPVEKIRMVEKALSFYPHDRQLLRILADACKSTGQWQKAAGAIEKLMGSKDDPALLEESLECYSAAGDTQAVMGVLQRLVQQNPDDESALRRLAELLDQAEKPGEAAEYYEKLLKRTPHDQRMPIYSRLAFIYAQNGQYGKAIQDYLELTRVTQDDPNLYYNLAYLYGRTGDEEKADQYLETALSLNKDDREGRLRLAHHLFDRSKFEKARFFLDQVLKAKPDDYEALLLMAQILEKLEQKAPLRDVYARIVALDPQNNTALFNLGILEYEADDLKAALPTLKAYLNRVPDDAVAHTMLFDLYRRQGNTPEALREARLLTQLTPTNLAVYNYLFATLQAEEDYKGIVEVMQPAIKANPSDSALRQYLVVAYLKSGREDLAMLELVEILRLEPKNEKLWLHLARLREKHDDLSRAVEAYQRVLELDPNNEEASEAYLRLRLKKLDHEPGR